MTEVVDIDGVELHVTPADEVGFPMNIVVALIAGRIARKLQGSGQLVDVEDDVYQILEICVEDGVRRETLATLDPHDLGKIISVVFDEPDADPDTDLDPEHSV